MARSTLKERLSHIDKVKAFERVEFGSARTLHLAADGSPDVVSACLALIKRGAVMSDAKRAVEKAFEEGGSRLTLTSIESHEDLAHELKNAGIRIKLL